jgi:hypothetical protein
MPDREEVFRELAVELGGDRQIAVSHFTRVLNDLWLRCGGGSDLLEELQRVEPPQQENEKFFYLLALAAICRVTQYQLFLNQTIWTGNRQGGICFNGDGSIERVGYPGPEAIDDPYWKWLSDLVHICGKVKDDTSQS